MLCGIALDIMRAIQYMHSIGVAHGDIKLENVMLKYSHRRQRYVAKLGDFEFSTYANKYTFSDSSCCTPEYAAPELFLKIKRHPFFPDIWALGVCLYILFEGKYPFYDDILLVTEIRKMEILALLICQTPLIILFKKMKTNIEFLRLVTSILNPSMENRPTIDECFMFPFIKTMNIQELSLDTVRRLESISDFKQYPKITNDEKTKRSIIFGEETTTSSNTEDYSSFSE
jgi:serine/threonine protein kinase